MAGFFKRGRDDDLQYADAPPEKKEPPSHDEWHLYIYMNSKDYYTYWVYLDEAAAVEDRDRIVAQTEGWVEIGGEYYLINNINRVRISKVRRRDDGHW